MSGFLMIQSVHSSLHKSLSLKRIYKEMNEDRFRKSMSTSPLYRSTIDDLVAEDNVILITEELKVFVLFMSGFKFVQAAAVPSDLIFLFLQKKVDKHEMYISAYQQGLGARNRMTIGGLLIFVVVLVTITAAFAVALVHYKGHEYEHEHDKRIDSSHQIGYQ